MIFDNCKIIDINFLRKEGYFKKGNITNGTLKWSYLGTPTGEISFKINLKENTSKKLILSYKINETNLNYNVPLEPIKSNLGKGYLWYFRCPITNIRCTKLHLIGQYFCHRTNALYGLYESQIESKKFRYMKKLFSRELLSEHYYYEITKKHFKTHYKSKPTKRYLALLKKINRLP